MDNYYRETRIARLPACQSCYTKKSKCDNARPKCTPCTKSSCACYTVSMDGSEPISREYIHELEQQMGNTPARTQNNSPVHTTEAGSETSTIDNISSGNLDSHSSDNEGIGIRFMSVLFTDFRWKEQSLKLLQDLSRVSTALETSVQPNPLPSAEQARIIFDRYLNGSHIQNPFLLRRDVQQLYHLVFSTESSQGEVSKHDLYRTLMILAIGSIHMFRNGTCGHHPYGYYAAAMQYLDSNILSGGMESIQDLLLIVRFGIYHHIGTSIWELVGVCVRMCIENNLHKLPRRSSKKTSILLNEQLQRRVFWECYMIDRYSSITLGRPPAIADEDIRIGFPANANDEEIDAVDVTGSLGDLDSFCQAIAHKQSTSTANSEMSVFLLCLRLRRITSKIQKFRRNNERANNHPSTFTVESITASGRIHMDLEKLLSKLESWRRSAPFFASPRTLYETQEWYDLLLLREKLILLRMAIDIVPKQRNNIPPLHLVSGCLQAATGTITHFCAMFTQSKVTYTRSYFQMLFAAGLSVMYCISVIEHDPETIMHATSAMDEAKKTLEEMGNVLKDPVPYVAIYKALQANILGKLSATGEYHRSGFRGRLDSSDYGMPGYVQRHQQPVQSSRSCFALPGVLGTTMEDEEMLGQLLSPWDILGDNTLWDMEAGMGEYAYGDPMALFSNIDEV